MDHILDGAEKGSPRGILPPQYPWARPDNASQLLRHSPFAILSWTFHQSNTSTNASDFMPRPNVGFMTFSRTRLAPVGSMVGDSGAGKTFLSCLLVNRPLTSHLATRTPGITVMLSPTTQQNNEHQCAFAILDSAGDNRPCSFEEHADVRANEIVRRAVVVRTAQTVVFVTNQFDRTCQEKLTCLIKSHMAGLRKLSPQNRLIVVHNRIEVTGESILQRHVAEVQRCYPLHQIPGAPDWGWEVDKDQETGVTVYRTEYCVPCY